MTNQEGDLWTVDENHADYPRQKAPYGRCLAGTELGVMLSWMGIPVGECPACEENLAMFDSEGCLWVKDNVDSVVRLVEEEAVRRHINFSSEGIRFLVLSAVRKAEERV